jgi:nitroreductase/dihydropteridine reductase
MTIIDSAKKRYATKKFDSSKKIPKKTVEEIKELLRLAPSSVNSQPWHFIIAETEEGKARVAKSTQDFYSFNLQKIMDASHVIVFCAKTQLDESFLERLTEKEQEDGRFSSEQSRLEQHSKRKMFVDFHKDQWKDLPCWTAKQVYLNLGAFLLGVAELGLDAVPIEGFDFDILDEEFGLKEKHLASVALVAVGYGAHDDFNLSLPKSRLDESEILTLI